jgi:HK97 family phage major capsid protein
MKMDLNEILQKLQAEFQGFATKHQEEVKSLGAATTETKSALDALRAKLDDALSKMDEAEAQRKRSLSPGGERKSLCDLITSAPEYAEAKSGDFVSRRPINITLKSSAFLGSTFLERKDVTEATLGDATSGVLVQQRLPGLVPLAQQALRIRDLMAVIPQATGNSFDYVYQQARTNVASPQVEGSAKSESTYNWQTASGSIRTIAHFVDVSKQALADVPWLRPTVDGELVYGLKVKEEAEILSGDGTGVHLNGIITQATAFDTNYLKATPGWTRLDILRYAKLQARLAGLATYAPSAFVLHPTDLAELELTKDDEKRYVIGDPAGRPVGIITVPFVWNLPVVESDSISAGTFLVGAFNSAAALIDRQAVSVEISYEHGDNFTLNMATILCEERIGLAVKKADAFITGSFTTSPE